MNAGMPSFDPRSQTHSSAMGVYKRTSGFDGSQRIVRTSSNFGSGSANRLGHTFDRRG